MEGFVIRRRAAYEFGFSVGLKTGTWDRQLRISYAKK